MTTRTVAQITDASNEHVGPFKIKNVLPTRTLKQVDPFLLIHHMTPNVVEASAELRLPPHPHAGFEVVTYLLDGEFFHRDSKGHNQVATGGDINWMTSGNGIVHSEGPTAHFLQKGGTVQLLQIWINLPSDKKTLDASFRHYAAGSLPEQTGEGLWVKTLIGTYNGQSSPIATHTPMFLHHVKVKAGTLFTLPVENSYSAALYILNGKLKLVGEEVKAGQLADFQIDGDQVVVTAVTDADFILFGGEPIKEKVVSYGPFVMNSFEEIQEAIRNYEIGKMGVLDY
ncbi:pirin family protein [Paraflavitalea sp. CAU 1676]|uniref:pirin family protein n=1 Tax=Paraflavitalea sp. CAU 1676 TaxID=3032598 RepID=UPI0023DB373F|nr:pirin family protein [Paraflavitalea sp. CAU 1676]MDF2187111.1 pirin family protein [Paraflavitalea sp. CAU 1676]